MASGPTQNYDDARLVGWRPRPAAAAALRVGLALLPVAVAVTFGLLAVRLVPPDRVGLDPWLWLAVEVALSAVVLVVVTRAARRLLPLSTLLRLTLVFPDRAPSRFAVARRTYSPEALRARLDRAEADGVAPRAEDRDALLLLDLVAALNAHDRTTFTHSSRVQAYAALIAREMGLSRVDAARLSWAALLHDVGKLSVPQHILTKPSRPDSDEWCVITGHAAEGARIAEPLAQWLGPWVSAVGQHHERWDGAGYPAGLAGTDIHLGARIVAVADTFDVITSARPYKRPLSPDVARGELARCAGTQFDPEVVRAFLAVGLGELRGVAGPLAVLSALPGIPAVPLPDVATVAARFAVVGPTAPAATTAVVVGAGLAVAPTVALADTTPPEPAVAVVSAVETLAATRAPDADRAAELAAALPAWLLDDAPEPAGALEPVEVTDEPQPAGSPAAAPPVATTAPATVEPAEVGSRSRPGRARESVPTVRADDAGRPADVGEPGPARPADASPPAHAGEPGRPEHAGEPGPPAHAGRTGPPEHGEKAGPAAHGGEPGRPPHAGEPGPPAHAGKPEHARGSDEAPGASGDTPGRSGDAPGRSGEAPGRSGEAPGRSNEAPGRSGEAPGRSR